VGVDDAERVVDVPERPEPADVVVGDVDDRGGDQADQDRAVAVDEAGGRRDRHEADDHPVDAADERGLAAGEVVPDHPRQERDRGAEVRVQDGGRGVGARVVGVAAVEAVPAEPEEPRAGRDHEQVVRRVDLAIARQPRADHRGGDEAGHARREVDHVPARVVERTLVRPPAAAPDQEGVHDVHARDPERHEHEPGLEVDAPEHGAEHQERRDRREDELEVDERGVREVPRRPAACVDVRDRRLPELLRVVEHGAGLADEVAPEAVVGDAVPRVSEAHREAVEDPDDQHAGERGEREHHAVHRPALLHHAAVEHDEAGDAHQADERRRGQLPGVVARVQPGWVGKWSCCKHVRSPFRPRDHTRRGPKTRSEKGLVAS